MTKLLTEKQRLNLEAKEALTHKEVIRLRNHYYALLKQKGFDDIEWTPDHLSSYKSNFVKGIKGQHSIEKPLSAYEIETLQAFLNKYQRFDKQLLLSLRNLVSKHIDVKFNNEVPISPSQFAGLEYNKQLQSLVRKYHKLRREYGSKQIVNKSIRGVKASESCIILYRDCTKIYKALNSYFYALLRAEGLTYLEVANYMNITIDNKDIRLSGELNTDTPSYGYNVSGNCRSLDSTLSAYKTTLASSEGLKYFESFKPVYNLLQYILGAKSFKKITVFVAIKNLLKEAYKYNETREDEITEAEIAIEQNTKVLGL